MTVKDEDFAIPAFPLEVKNLPTLSPGNFPTGLLPVLVSYTMDVNLFVTPQKIPAGGFPTPEIRHFFLPPTPRMF
jgi:hypothetical protein